MLPDSILPTPEDDIARVLRDYERRLAHLERLEDGGMGLGARAFRTSSQVIPNAVETVITWDSEAFDTDNIHSTVANTSRLTANTTGLYIIVGSGEWGANGVGRRFFSLFKNGAVTEIREERSALASQTRMHITFFDQLIIGDFYELSVFQTSGGNLNLSANESAGAFWMVKVGQSET